MTPRSEHPSALAYADCLVSPVIERRSADDEIEGAIGRRDALGTTLRNHYPPIGRRSPSRIDHRARGIDPHKPGGVGTAAREHAEQVAGSASHIQDRRRDRVVPEGNVRGALSDLVVEATEPPFLVAHRALLEGGYVSLGGHVGIVPAHQAETRATRARSGCGLSVEEGTSAVT